MTGIERLRTLAGAWDEWGLGGTLAEIADQIERELQEERDRWDDDLSEAEVSWNAVAGVCLDMERHVSGVEGAEDSPVARWARELRAALGGDRRDRAADVSVSAYDLLPQEERDAIAWVREHGGLDMAASRFESGEIAADMLWGKGHGRFWTTDEFEEEISKRLMPEGMEWPKVDGKPVDFKTCYAPSVGALEAVSIYSNGACEVMSHDGIIKPVSEIHVVVPAADGEPLEAGQTVWDANGDELVIVALEDGGHTVACRYVDVGDGIPVHGMWSPSDLTHERPVLGADGVPIREGDTVWHEDGTEMGVLGFGDEEDGETIVRVEYVSGPTRWGEVRSLSLTHTKPEPDSWSSVWADVSNGNESPEGMMRRCRALAERERGE